MGSLVDKIDVDDKYHHYKHEVDIIKKRLGKCKVTSGNVNQLFLVNHHTDLAYSFILGVYTGTEHRWQLSTPLSHFFVHNNDIEMIHHLLSTTHVVICRYGRLGEK